jgi:predicted dehydrogenase
MAAVSVLVVGAGSRGSGYAGYIAQHPAQAQVVGVAEPRPFYRQRLAEQHRVPATQVFADWREAASRPRFADAVIITTQDAMHAEPAEAFARLGYHMVLEKPMAPTPQDCWRIFRAVEKAAVLFAVCHVMRYTAYSRQMKALIEKGAVGEVVNIQQLEPVGYWHQAHSFVRGNWRNSAESSPMLLAKSCHDLDWLRYLMGVPCKQVSSFGSLVHFRPEAKPPGAADRCLDCACESDCPYSAKRFYLGKARDGKWGWPVDVLTPERTEAAVLEALRRGPYGRCVYACDNDVVDNQVVNMLFAGGRTSSFTMTAFNEGGNRRTRVFGTRGELIGDGSTIECFDFLSNTRQVIDTRAPDGSLAGGHGGGDYGLMRAFVEAVARQDASPILSGPEETLDTHMMVFAAEEARAVGTVVDVDAFKASHAG